MFRPPERITVSEWADKNRILDGANCAIPGKWKTSFTPYLRGIMDAYSDPRCRRHRVHGVDAVG